MNNANGWIKIYRKLTEWGWFTDANTLQLFIYLLCEANTQEAEFNGITIHKGQVVIGRKVLASRLGRTERQIRTSLNHLKSTNEVTAYATNKFTIITICNYDKYQGRLSEDRPTNRPTNRPTSDQQSTTIEEYKNIRSKEEKKNIDSSSLPNGIPQLQDIIRECKGKGYIVDPVQFFAYYEANGWVLKENKPMRNWRAALYQWNKKEKGNGNVPHRATEVYDLKNEHLKKYDHPNAISYEEFERRNRNNN